jgi:hypothetical protein
MTTKARALANLLSQGNLFADGQVQASEVTGLHTVATTGSYADLVNKPTVVSHFTNDANYASTTYVNTQMSNMVASAPAALDTLNELAAALGNDANFSTTTATALGNRLRVDTAAQSLTSTQKTNAKTNLDLQNVENKSSATIRGELTSTNVTTALGFTPYNSTNPNAYISGNQTITFSGDATGSGAVTVALTLANSGVTAGTYGSSTNIPQLVVDAKGRVTSVSNVAVSIPSGALTFTGDVTGSGSTGSSTALTLANSGVTAGTYTKVTVDAKGRVTTGATLASADLPTYTGSLTSAQVTGALGFTPYNSTNPSGYITNTGNARVGVENNGTLVGTRRNINFIPGTGVSLTITDDSANEEVDVTVTNTGVTSVSGTGSVSGLTLSGTVTTTGSLTLGGTLTLTSAQITSGLGFTPYNSTNPSGYTSNTGTVTSVSGTGTVSGLTLTGTVTSSGSLTLGGTLSTSIDNITDEHRLFNNMGDNHGTRTSFDASTPSYNFGWRYVQGSGNGPGVNSATQYYSLYVGLGNDYPATGSGSYGMQIAIPRNVTTPYLTIRYNEANSLAAWQKISAGYADSAGAVAWTNVSGRPTAVSSFTNDSGYITSSGSITGSAGSVTGLTLNNVNASINPDNVTQNQIGYNTSVSLFGQTDGGLYSSAYSSSWIHQIYGDFRTGQIATRGKNSGTWQAWRVQLDSSNFTNYVQLPYTGWPGSPGTDANTFLGGSWVRTSFTYSNNAPLTGCIASFPAGGYDIQLNGNYNGNEFSMRSRNGDNGTWTSWKRLLTDSNYTSYTGGLSTTNNWTGANYFRSNQNTTGSSPPLQAYSSDSGGAIMSFHRGGYYAVNMGLDSDNVFRIGGWSASANRLQMDMSGNLTMAGNVTAYSDERLKKDWLDLPSDFVERLALVKSGTYTRTDESMRQVGVSAQSLEKLLPEAVLEGEYLSVSYGNAALAACVELAKELVNLRKQIAALQAEKQGK